jgi:hypothetical protein
VSKIERICAYYSRGPHFVRNLKTLRQAHPDAHLTAIVPPDYPVESLGDRADTVEPLGLPADGRRDTRAVLRLARHLRAGRHDLFVVMFDSPKLRLLASLSGARRAECLTIDGRRFPVRFAPVAQFLGGLWRRARGNLTYARVWLVVRFRKVH